jgi:hypothetical protein
MRLLLLLLSHLCCFCNICRWRMAAQGCSQRQCLPVVQCAAATQPFRAASSIQGRGRRRYQASQVHRQRCTSSSSSSSRGGEGQRCAAAPAQAAATR